MQLQERNKSGICACCGQKIIFVKQRNGLNFPTRNGKVHFRYNCLNNRQYASKKIQV